MSNALSTRQAGKAPQGGQRFNPEHIKNVAGILDDVGDILSEGDGLGAVNMSPSFTRRAPIAIQRLQALPMQQLPAAVQPIVRSTGNVLAQLLRIQTQRKADLALAPNTPITVAFQGVAAGATTVTATVKAPYNGQPWEVMAMEANDRFVNGSGGSLFLFDVVRFAGINMSDPSSQQVTYPAGVGTPTVPGMDLVTVLAHNKVKRPENQWRPWTGLVFTPDAEIDFRATNIGTATGSVAIILHCKATPCGKDYDPKHLVSLENVAKVRQAIRLAQFKVRGF